MQPPYGGWNQPQMNNEQIDLHSQSESQSQSQAPWMVRSLNRALPVNKGTANIFYKTRICKRFWAGYCRKGEVCSFAHGIEDLRQPPPNWLELVGPEPVKEMEMESETVRPVLVSVGAANATVQVTEESCGNKWTDSKKINQIYGDWIDDLPVGQE